jgi:hypothetical protein
MTAISRNDIEGITHGRLGRTMAMCPLCSGTRRTPQKRHSKVLAVTLIEPEFAVYHCNHCEAQGYCRPDTPPRPNISGLIPAPMFLPAMKTTGRRFAKSSVCCANWRSFLMAQSSAQSS